MNNRIFFRLWCSYR